jgi:hypothetical protein
MLPRLRVRVHDGQWQHRMVTVYSRNAPLFKVPQASPEYWDVALLPRVPHVSVPHPRAYLLECPLVLLSGSVLYPAVVGRKVEELLAPVQVDL